MIVRKSRVSLSILDQEKGGEFNDLLKNNCANFSFKKSLRFCLMDHAAATALGFLSFRFVQQVFIKFHLPLWIFNSVHQQFHRFIVENKVFKSTMSRVNLSLKSTRFLFGIAALVASIQDNFGYFYFIFSVHDK